MPISIENCKSSMTWTRYELEKNIYYINYNAWRKLQKLYFTYFNSSNSIHSRSTWKRKKEIFHAFTFLFCVCLLTMLYVRFFVFYSLKMRETLKVENRCCLRTLILFMCVFSLIFFSYYTFTFSFSCSMAQQPPTTTIILISFLLRILCSLPTVPLHLLVCVTYML